VFRWCPVEESHAENADGKIFCRVGRSKSAQRVKGRAIALFGRESTALKPTTDDADDTDESAKRAKEREDFVGNTLRVPHPPWCSAGVMQKNLTQRRRERREENFCI